MKETFFTADTHFGHKNVIPYCKRPYTDTHEMDEDLIKKWNETVSPDDTIFHLGDFAFASQLRTKEIIGRLNGYKILIMGNHDRKNADWWESAGFNRAMKPPYGQVVSYLEGPDKAGVRFYMSHFPHREVMGEYDQRDYLAQRAPQRAVLDRPLVHGHVHESWKLRPNLVNAGVDVWGYKPVHLSKVLECVNHVRDLADGDSV